MSPVAQKPLKRGWPAQRDRREANRSARRRAVAFDRWACHHGLTHHEAADRLGVARSTLAHWERQWCKDHLAVQPRGRSCHRGDHQTRNAAIRLMTILGPRTGLPTLQAIFPELARGEIQNLQRRFRRLWRRNHRRLLRVLHWHCPGTVWAMDHTEPPQVIDGRWRHILAVRNMASRMQLGWLPVESEGAQETCHALEDLFRRHGPPLVLKSDNGSAFIDDDTQRLLARWDVFPLFSPPRTPQYNGSCEAGNGAMKTRTEHQAILGTSRANGRPLVSRPLKRSPITSIVLGAIAGPQRPPSGNSANESLFDSAWPSAAPSKNTENRPALSWATRRTNLWTVRPRPELIVWQSVAIALSAAYFLDREVNYSTT